LYEVFKFHANGKGKQFLGEFVTVALWGIKILAKWQSGYGLLVYHQIAETGQFIFFCKPIPFLGGLNNATASVIQAISS